MKFKDRLLQQQQEPVKEPPPKPAKDWWSTGWGPRGDQPNPLLKLGKVVKGEALETVSDLKDEPLEVPYRIPFRLRKLVTGRD